MIVVQFVDVIRMRYTELSEQVLFSIIKIIAQICRINWLHSDDHQQYMETLDKMVTLQPSDEMIVLATELYYQIIEEIKYFKNGN